MDDLACRADLVSFLRFRSTGCVHARGSLHGTRINVPLQGGLCRREHITENTYPRYGSRNGGEKQGDIRGVLPNFAESGFSLSLSSRGLGPPPRLVIKILQGGCWEQIEARFQDEGWPVLGKAREKTEKKKERTSSRRKEQQRHTGARGRMRIALNSSFLFHLRRKNASFHRDPTWLVFSLVALLSRARALSSLRGIFHFHFHPLRTRSFVGSVERGAL